MKLSSIIAARHRAVAGFSTEAQNYFDRLDTAGDTTYTAYKQPLANYIDSLVALGGAYWDDMKSAASFVGVGFQGITVPLRDGMPVLSENNFIAADLDQVTGLKGDASLKYISTGVVGTDLAQNDSSTSVWYSEIAATVGYLLGSTSQFGLRDTGGGMISGIHSSGLFRSGAITTGLVGATRSDGSNITTRRSNSDETVASSSTSPNSTEINLYRLASGATPTDARIATYHVGPALDLATLEGLQDTLITEVAAI